MPFYLLLVYVIISTYVFCKYFLNNAHLLYKGAEFWAEHQVITLCAIKAKHRYVILIYNRLY